MTEAVRVRPAVLRDVVEHARQEAPLECCGLLLGRDGLIEEAVRTPNVFGSATRFRVEPRAHFATLKRARAEDRQILGAYHSHPRSPAVPSPRDVAEAHDRSLVHLIVSLSEEPPVVRAWRLLEERSEPVALELGVEPAPSATAHAPREG